MQGKLADMYTTMNACKAYVYAVGRHVIWGKLLGRRAAFCMLLKATWMAGETIQCLGGNGYMNEYSVGRIWRDAGCTDGAGTSEIRRWLIGREIMRPSF